MPYRLAVLDEPRPEQLLRPLVVTVASEPGVERLQHLGSEDASVAVLDQHLVPEPQDAVGVGPPGPGVGLNLDSLGERGGGVGVPAHRALNSPGDDRVVLAVGVALDPSLECRIACPIAPGLQLLARLTEGVREYEQRESAPGGVVGF